MAVEAVKAVIARGGPLQVILTALSVFTALSALSDTELHDCT